ncbi:PDZ domain-containing protein, partial [Yersinia enterocolitica]|uniref:PDZ domain-containing protein n=1 Tax=Yersinia enterocolitica TaxID=630 RepID=UPI0020C44580
KMGENKPRLCHLVKWPDFQGYGFNLHAERGKAGQFIGKVDDGSPAEAAGLKSGDRIVEINGVNIGNENHQQVVGRIKAGGDEVSILVVDTET